jgi:glycine oxidase
MSTSTDDCLIVGGGVIGLSLAYVLAKQGLKVRILEAGEPGQQASWAGAGILPPASAGATDPLERFTAWSNVLHREWAAEFREQTGIDTGYRPCGGIYLARERPVIAELRDLVAGWSASGVEVQELSADHLSETETALQPTPAVRAAVRLPDERQLRNPRHLQALIEACRLHGVKIESQQSVEEFTVLSDRVDGVRTQNGAFSAATVCLTSGCWSGKLAAQLGLSLPIKPIRGQIALLASDRPLVTHVINESRRYLVPREDGRTLVGSTEEDVGYVPQTTAEAIDGLIAFAATLVPALAGARFERAWAGLRPASADGLPYLGRIAQLQNTFVAAGHFRSGIQLSPATAVSIASLILGQEPPQDLTPFSPERATGAAPQPDARHGGPAL